MKTYFDCFPCFFHQTKRTGELLEIDENTIWKLLKGVSKILSEADINCPPPKTASFVYDFISRTLRNPDPFRHLKRESIEHALSLFKKVRARIHESSDRLESAIRYAAAGNVIDYGISSDFDLLNELDTVANREFFKWEYHEFLKDLKEAPWVLILGDNCGESVFDRLLIEELKRPVYYAVRGAPIINDVTKEDAISSGIGEVAKIVSTGCKAPGIVFDWCSREFLDLFKSAPLIISKGQGNFETLSDKGLPIYFLFKIKCTVVAKYLSCPLGSLYFGKSLVIS